MSAPSSTASYTVLEAIEHQAASCARIGSPLYASLLTGLAADYLSAGLTAELLEGVSSTPVHDAVPLRYLATAHRLALSGDAPELAAHYPSCGGTWDGSDITDVFLSAVATHRGEFVRGLQLPVQTNEVGRAAVLASGFSLVAERHGLPLRTLELGASAGLLSRWPHYAYDTGESRGGDPRSEVRFDASWFRAPLPALHQAIEVAGAEACDLSPIDAASAGGRVTMMSFLWPDQGERLERMRAALRIAETHPITLAQADAGEWLGARLADAPTAGRATVVFHAIVWQYLPPATRDAVRAALADAGSRASADAPLCWLRMEPATAEHADLRLTTWPGGRDEVLAHVGYHGADIRWLG